MNRRVWLMLVVTVVAIAALLPGSVLADDECDYEPYSTVCVPATSMATTTAITDPGTDDSSSAVLGNTVQRAGEQLPNTGGFQSGWLAAGGLLLVLVGVSMVWVVRSRSDA